MSDDRSERLRKRRRQSMAEEEPATPRGKNSPRKDDNGTHPSNQNTSAEQTTSTSTDAGRNGGSTDSENGTVSVKEEQTGTYMYLPKSQTKDLRRLYNVLKAEYEFRYDEEFEKNRHFYPLVIQYGLEELDGMDASEIRTRLEAMR